MKSQFIQHCWDDECASAQILDFSLIELCSGLLYGDGRKGGWGEEVGECGGDVR